MTPTWFLTSVVLPILAAFAAYGAFRHRTVPPALLVLLNGLMPGSGLAAAERPLLEVAGGVLLAQLGMIFSGGPDPAMLIPIGVIGAAWGVVHTPWNPLTDQSSPGQPAVPPRPARSSSRPGLRGASALGSPNLVGPAEMHEDTGSDHDTGYAVAVRCTECGADVAVSVLQHAAQCEFCGSHHLVVGHEDVLQVAIPERVSGPDELRSVVLDHLRYRYYLKLYERSVAPLERQATFAGPTGGLATSSDVEAASIAAEKAISRKADRYRAKIAETLEITHTQHFMAPYHHSTGTLYQAAFGRDRKNQDKQLRFALDNLEISVPGQAAIDLPAMGKLSYLRALVPAAQLPNDTQVVPADNDHNRLEAARRDLHRKQIDRTLQTIRVGSHFAEDARAVVWRPWWVAEVEGSGIHETLLVDGAGGSVAGAGAFVDPKLFEPLPPESRDESATLTFQAMQCPTCGYEFRYEADAVLHFCSNCHRLFSAGESGKLEVGYDQAGPAPDKTWHLVPFWRFPLQLRTSDGHVITDLRHLRDGIDGTFDQIGEATTPRQDSVWIPAIRCLNPQLMTRAFNHLFVYLWQRPPRVKSGRFPLDEKVQPWPVCLSEREVRELGPLFLTNAFGPRDIARVNVNQVDAWLFEGRFEAAGKLAYVPIPQAVAGPFQRYIGRRQGRALKGVRRGLQGLSG